MALVDITPPIATLDLAWGDAWESPGTEAWRSLAAGILELAGRGDIECIVVRGVGKGSVAKPASEPKSEVRGPQAGIDSPDGSGLRTEAIVAALRGLRAVPHPTVALIEGTCVGWGLEVSTCCDLRVCGESTRLGAAVDGARLIGLYDEMRPLAQLLGPTSALDFVLDGGLLDAGRARTLGLVNRVAPDGSAPELAYGLAARVAAGAPLVNRSHKRMVRRLYGATIVAH